MEFDLTSVIIGIVISGFIAWFFFWSEKCSLANRIAYSCCEKARLLVNCKRELVIKSENIDPFELEDPIEIDNKVFPIEDDEFKIVLLPSERVQTDVHISEYIGVYSKQYDLWLMIEDTVAFLDEGSKDSYRYYFCRPDFKDKQFVKTPFSFNVSKYLIRVKTGSE